jgi:hypothetical protein
MWKLRLVRLLVLTPFVTPPTLAAQASSEQPSSTSRQPPATVVVGDATAPPNWEVRVPVSLKVDSGIEVGRLTLRIVYRPDVLQFLRVERPQPLEEAGFDVKAETLKDSDPQGTASLRLTADPTADPPRALPVGPVANLVFKVANDAEPGTSPVGARDVSAWQPAPATAAVEAGAGAEATVTIAPEGLPIFACFFYMH